MEIKPIGEVIPRERHPGTIPVLDFFADTIDKIIDFSSNIFGWEDHAKGAEEDIAPTMLLRHFLDLLDAIAILIRNSSADPSKLILRGILETHFSLDFLLGDDSAKRALAFFVEDVLTDISLLEKMIFLRDYRNGKDRRFRVNEVDITLDEVLKAKREILQLPKFADIHAEFVKLKGKKKYYPHWYQCFQGSKSIRGIAEKLNKTDLYDNIYSMYSRNTHGTDVIAGRLSNSGPFVDIVQLRRPNDAQQVSRFAVYLANTTIRNYLEKRIPCKIDLYKSWFSSVQIDINKIMGIEILNFE